MLNEIYIRNYLFVPEQRLKFGPGMTVLSGETGAGKSILVGSISLIFGETPSPPEAYDSSQPIYLEASFDPGANSELRDWLREQERDPEEELCLAREISVAGKSSYFINGRRASASLMRELKPLIIDFHHQRDQQKLLSGAYQLRLLDKYAQNESLRGSFSTLYRQLKQGLKSLASLREEEERNSQLRELYQYQYEELEKAALKTGEDRLLQQEFDQLSHAREIGELAAASAFDLYERESGAYQIIRQAVSSLERFAELDPRLSGVEQSLREALEAIADSASTLTAIAENSSGDPDRLEQIQARLNGINELLYKHKAKDIDELLEIFSQRQAQIDSFADLSERIQKLQKQLAAQYGQLRRLGAQLSQSRQTAAKKLCSELRDNIRLLSIPDARFEIIIDKIADADSLLHDYLDLCNDTGEDSCRFLFSANRGSDLKPLSDVASGGELSRILLALKKVLADKIEQKLIILDEIDAGIGGKTAERVAEFIHSLAERHRILCITHLAQIAAIAHQHIALEKVPGEPKSVIRMTALQRPERLDELARMLSGDVSDISRKHAEEMINKYNTRG